MLALVYFDHVLLEVVEPSPSRLGFLAVSTDAAPGPPAHLHLMDCALVPDQVVRCGEALFPITPGHVALPRFVVLELVLSTKWHLVCAATWVWQDTLLEI